MLENWGLMTEAQDNPKTITQKINELILAHEADPESHMGAGESIENHRTNEIIDHPAGAIVPDKFSFNQKEINTYFESILSWQKAGNVISQFLKLQVGIYGNAIIDSYAYQDSIYFYCADDYTTFDNYVQFNGAYSNYYSIADLYFGMGVSDAVPSSDYLMCFKISGNVCSVGFSRGGSIIWTSVGVLTEQFNHVFRIQTSKEFQEVYFLIDGVIVYTGDLSGMSDWAYGSFGIYAHKTGGTTNGQYKAFVTNFLAYWSEYLGSYRI